MTLGVQSFPELYTLLIGWSLYDQLWALLTQTGIAFLPFLGIVLRNMARPYESQDTKDAASTSLRRMEVSIIATLFIIFLGVSPFIPLNATMVSYTPICQSDGQSNTFHPGNTQTTWDNAFAVPAQAIYVPLWWYAVISVSEGFASAANTMVQCVPNLRQMVSTVDMTQLTDPTLKQQLQQFELQCYIPARTQYLQDSQNNTNTNQTINNDRQQYGADDTEWLGSHGFQDVYYQNLRAQQPISGFPYDPNEDINADTNQNNPPAYGMPSCFNWWNDSQNGLKNHLSTALPTNFWDQFKTYFDHDTNDQLKDDVIKRLVNNANGYDKANNTIGNYGYSRGAESLGSWFNQLTTYPKLYAAAESAPIIQALLLLLIYTFLPFAIVFSGYRVSAFLTGAAILFSMIFWSFIWHLVSYVDSTLMNALYGTNWFSHQSPSATLADMITGSLLLIAPLFWFSFMGAMGVAVGDIVSNSFSNMNRVGEGAATEGANTIKSSGGKVAKLAGKLIEFL